MRIETSIGASSNTIRAPGGLADRGVDRGVDRFAAVVRPRPVAPDGPDDPFDLSNRLETSPR